jgi:hypothetical protein
VDEDGHSIFFEDGETITREIILERYLVYMGMTAEQVRENGGEIADMWIH